MTIVMDDPSAIDLLLFEPRALRPDGSQADALPDNT